MSDFNTTIETRFTANADNFEDMMKRIEKTASKTFTKIQKQNSASAIAMAKAFDNVNLDKAFGGISSSIGDIKAQLISLAPVLAGALGSETLFNAINSYTQLQNSLKITGLQGQSLLAVQNQLFAIADKSKVPVNDLADLYQKMSVAGSALNLTESQRLTMTDSISQAIRASGVDANTASGAMLQLSQALSGLGKNGTVRMAEWRSVMAGMPALNVAIAKSFGMTASELDNMVANNKLTVDKLVEGLIKANSILNEMTANTAATPTQAITTFSNAVVKFAGQLDSAYGISRNFEQLMKLLADDLPLLVSALQLGANAMIGFGVAGAAMKVPGMITSFQNFAFVSKLVAQETGEVLTSTVGLKAGLAGLAVGEDVATVSTIGLSTAMKGLLISTGIGIALIALSYAVEAAMGKWAEHKKLVDDNTDSMKRAKEETVKLYEVNDKIANGQKNVQSNLIKTGNVVDDLVQKYFGLRDAATQAAAAQEIQGVMNAVNERKKYEKELDERTGYDRSKGKFKNAGHTIGMGAGTFVNTGPTYSDQSDNKDWKNDPRNKELMDGIQNQQKLIDDHNKNLVWLQKHDAPTNKPAAATANTNSSAHHDAVALDRYTNMADAADIKLAANETTRFAAVMKSINDNYATEQKKIETDSKASPETKKVALDALAKQKQVDDQQAQREHQANLRKANEQVLTATLATYQLQLSINGDYDTRLKTLQSIQENELQIEDAKHEEELAAIANNNTLDDIHKEALTRAENDRHVAEQTAITLDIKKQENDLLEQQLDKVKDLASIQIDMLNNQSELASTQKERLEYERQALAVQQKLDKAENDLRLKKLQDAGTYTQDDVDQNKAVFDQKQASDRAVFDKQHSTGAEKYWYEVQDNTIDPMYDAFKNLEDGIDGVIDRTKTLGEAFHDVAIGIVADLLKIAARQYILVPLAKAMGLDISATKVPGHEMGSNFTKAGLTAVGEGGMELVEMPNGAKVHNHADTKRLLNPFRNGSDAAQTPVINQHFNSTVNASGSIQKSDIDNMIERSNAKWASETKTATLSAVAQRDRNRFR